MLVEKANLGSYREAVSHRCCRFAGQAAADAEPAIDGIFRAVPNSLGNQPGGVFASKQGRWVVTLNLTGELYQAYFDTQVCRCFKSKSEALWVQVEGLEG